MKENRIGRGQAENQLASPAFARRVDRSLQRFVADGDVGALAELLAPEVVVRFPGAVVVGRDCVLSLLDQVRTEYIQIELETEHFTAPRLHTMCLRLTGRPRHTVSCDQVTLIGVVTLAPYQDKIGAIWANGGLSSPSGPVRTETPRARFERAIAECAQRWSLTRRELNVTKLVMQGMRDKEVAESLRLAPASTTKYLRNVMRKSGVTARWQLIQQAAIVRTG